MWKRLTLNICNCALKCRFSALILAAGIGLILCCVFYYFFYNDERIFANLLMLILSLPVLIVLWFFRTHDTKTQIEKTQSQIEKSQTNINLNILSKGVDLLLIKNPKIDNPNAPTPDFSPYINKRVLGLMMLIKLKRSDRQLADEINLATRNADLKGANLREIDLTDADLKGATYDKDTKFPMNFDSKDAGMVEKS